MIGNGNGTMGRISSSNYLQTAKVWVRLYNLPVNYLTLKTIDAVADGIGHVKVIEFDPEKPLLNDYIRVQVVLDLNLPVRDKKSVTLPGGRIEYVDVGYERIRKKCFHCLRLSHEKQKCPLLQGSRNKAKGIAGHQYGSDIGPSGVRQHHNNLADKIMPLLAPSIPPGFEPHASLVAPEVFEQMRLYMNCSDPEERIIREAKMKKTLNELSQDPIAQRSCLRLESAPKVAPLTIEGRGKIFDFSRVQSDQLLDGAESSSKGTDLQKRQRSKDPTERHQWKEVVETNGLMTSSSHRQDSVLIRTSDQFGTAPANLDDPKVFLKSPALAGGFTVGVGDGQIGERGSRSKSSHKSRSSWTRRNQNKRRVSSAEHSENHLIREDAAGKRKADEEGEVSSKMSRHNKGGLMVHQKPSTPQ